MLYLHNLAFFLNKKLTYGCIKLSLDIKRPLSPLIRELLVKSIYKLDLFRNQGSKLRESNKGYLSRSNQGTRDVMECDIEMKLQEILYKESKVEFSNGDGG